jgi:hypothetical protein
MGMASLQLELGAKVKDKPATGTTRAVFKPVGFYF